MKLAPRPRKNAPRRIDSATPTDLLVKSYTALAATYDKRWSGYLDASLRMTMEVVKELPASYVLDVACGTGQLLASIADRPDPPVLVGVDRVPAMLDVARQRFGQRASFLECNAAGLPFKDARFDMITNTNALHYFPDVSTSLLEIRRVISPHGNLVITDWCRDYLWMKALNRTLPWTTHPHAHTYRIDELTQCLALAGFDIVSISRKKIDWFWGLMTIRATPTAKH